jgi:hypothetical protein
MAEWIIKGAEGERPIGLFPVFVYYIREVVRAIRRYIRRRRERPQE